MKRSGLWFCLSLLFVASSAAAPRAAARSEMLPPPPDSRLSFNFDFDWLFLKSDPAGAEKVAYDDSAWRPLNVPHDWSIEGPTDKNMKAGRSMGFLPGGVAWYRKHFSLPAEYKGNKLSIEFDGIYLRSAVYLNGVLLGERPYGYVSFQYDLTPHLNLGGENVIAVRVDHSDAPTSRWYSGSGIYRHVCLVATDPLHVAHWGTYVTASDVSPASAAIQVRTTVRNEHKTERACSVLTTLLGPAGKELSSSVSAKALRPGEEGEFEQTVTVAKPELWSPERPVLYKAVTRIRDGRRLADTCETRFGIRAVRFDPDRGFFLNGVNLKMKGVCLHQDGGAVGVAVPDRVWERRLQTLKSIGCNAIRMSHNPPAPEILDMCDRLGFLVIDEAFDDWNFGYYGKYFDEWWRRDLDAMLQRDRNHPSIVLWSVGNEVEAQGAPEGIAILKVLVKHVHDTEPTRFVTCALAPRRDAKRAMFDINKTGYAQLTDVVGYNYQEPWYELDKKQYPDRIVLGTECYPFFRSSTTNQREFDARVNPWFDVVKHDYVAGQFVWPGIDYLGESSGWPSKGWPGGLVDTCGFVKPTAAFHRSVWSDEPMVGVAVLSDTLDLDPGRPHWNSEKMASHWTFPGFEGHVVRVQTQTNCETVELILNGESFGPRRSVKYPNRAIIWYVPYSPGTLRAVGRNGSNEVASDEIKTAGPPAKILLLPDRSRIAADGEDVSHLEVRIVDADGTLVPGFKQPIRFQVSGAGALLATDNGDLRSCEPYKGNVRTPYFGRCLAIVQADRRAGEIRVKAAAEGLPEAAVLLRAGGGEF